MGAGAQQVESAVDRTAAEEEVIKKIKDLMIKAGIDPKTPEGQEELAKAKMIYEKVLEFLRNTGFNPDLLPPHKY